MQIVYKPDGATLEAFLASNAVVRGLMGPIGSGKTLCGLMEGLRRANEQAPYPPVGPERERVRPSRGYVIRDTYRNLQKVIDDWKEGVFQFRLPGEMTGGKGEPAIHQMRVRRPDDTILHAHIVFAAIGDQNIEEFFRGLGATWIMLEEADTLPDRAVDLALGRLGRYPRTLRDASGAIIARPSWTGLWCMFNAPNVDNWCYKRFVEDKPDNWDFFVQPSGFAPNAENLKYLPGGRDYYEQQRGADKTYTRRMIENRFGYSRAGKPVYPDFDHDRHVSPTNLTVIPDRTIVVGLDGGRTPAAVFTQRDPEFRLCVLREFVTEDLDAKQFAAALLRFITREFPGVRFDLFRFVADPATLNKTESNEEAWLDIVARGIKARIRPARTNKREVRLAAVTAAMDRPMREGRFGLIVDPRCRLLIRGFVSEYRFRKMNRSYGMEFDDVPEKNAASHPQDALQYAAMEESDVVELGLRAHDRDARRVAAREAPRLRRSPHAWLKGVANG